MISQCIMVARSVNHLFSQDTTFPNDWLLIYNATPWHMYSVKLEKLFHLKLAIYSACKNKGKCIMCLLVLLPWCKLETENVGRAFTLYHFSADLLAFMFQFFYLWWSETYCASYFCSLCLLSHSVAVSTWHYVEKGLIMVVATPAAMSAAMPVTLIQLITPAWVCTHTRQGKQWLISRSIF